jgi:hypothetical protein
MLNRLNNISSNKRDGIHLKDINRNRNKKNKKRKKKMLSKEMKKKEKNDIHVCMEPSIYIYVNIILWGNQGRGAAGTVARAVVSPYTPSFIRNVNKDFMSGTYPPLADNLKHQVYL